jgi:NAD(P)-dependent dehydrogenase (short-subunit alcohol dehydrogenase family)
MMDEFFELLRMDNLDEASINAVVSAIIEKEGRIDLVVCNAGKTINGAVENIPVLEGARQMDVNFMGAARLISAVLPSMRINRKGTILVISSIAGRIGLPFNAYYSASKFALEGYVESLRLELAHSGIRIALIEPGSVRTGIDPSIALFTGGGDDVYADNHAKVQKILFDRAKTGIKPVVIARLIHRLMGKKKLKTRYYVGQLDQWIGLWLKYLLPARLYESILLKYFGIAKIREE